MKRLATPFLLCSLFFLFSCDDEKSLVVYTSDLAGQYNAVATMISPELVLMPCPGDWWTGRVVIEKEAGAAGDTSGIYILKSVNALGDTVEDPSMGAFYSCIASADSIPSNLPNGTGGAGILRIEDQNGALSWQGYNQWGQIYFFQEVTPNQELLTLKFEDDAAYEHVVKLTRTDGNNWPEELRVGN